jgi:hypothetical protein
MLHNKNQLPRLPGNAVNVMIPGVVWWWCGLVLTDYTTTPGDFVLG